MANNSILPNDLFSSLISDIKTYEGRDPLLPWLRGIRKMKEILPPQLLKEKLPRFLQKCVQTFETDRRYINDLRYLRVWMQLMDFVDDPKAVLRTMEANRIGMKKSLFYQAYALYYEKLKKYDDAETMYRLGVQNLAEPMAELQKSYEQFLHRMERHKNKIQHQGVRGTNMLRSAKGISIKRSETKGNSESVSGVKCRPEGSHLKESIPVTEFNYDTKKLLAQDSEDDMPKKDFNPAGIARDIFSSEVSSNPSVKNSAIGDFGCRSYFKPQQAQSIEASRTLGEDTVVIKFVDTAIVGKSDTEDARHHGLVEPTINTKEAMNAINSMFREPLQTALVGRRSRKSQPGTDRGLNGFEVFVDENFENGVESSHKKFTQGLVPQKSNRFETNQPLQEPLHIYIDDEEGNGMKKNRNENDNSEQSEVQNLTEGASISSIAHVNAFVFPDPHGHPSDSSKEFYPDRLPQSRFREDTVVYRFVGSTISDEPEVENACHHGLVEPTINLKEAMDDINSMFGKPMDFVRKTSQQKQDKAQERSKDCGGFLILPDDNLDQEQRKMQPSSSARNDSDLFEETLCTKEAMAEINKMFGMPLDF